MLNPLKKNTTMKKNYIAPNTEMTTYASMGLMEDPAIGFQTGSCGVATATYGQID